MYLFCWGLLVVKMCLAVQTSYFENDDKVAEHIFKSISQLDKNDAIKIKRQKIVRNSTIINIYKGTAYQPLWGDAQNRRDLLEILENAYYDGLNPQDYYIDFIRQFNQTPYYLHNDKNVAKADIIMTNAALTFALHMLQGKLQPTALDESWNYSNRPLPDSIEFRLLNRLNTKTLKDEVDILRSDLPLYNTLRNWFIRLDSIQKHQTEVPPFLYADKFLKFGDRSPLVSDLKKRLGIPVNQSDTQEANLFDKNLEEQIKAFQTQHGLKADGIAGAKTFEMLNRSPSQKMDILRVNMERCRWLKRRLHDDLLIVNIADYNLYYLKEQQLFYNTKVVVGKQHQQTPVFESAIKYIVYNPTWVVPYSISSKEILPIIQQDSTYLDRNDMFLSLGDSIVDYCLIDFHQYDEDNFPYVITQEAGVKNPLGLVKFIFPNKHAVYLHDTPAKNYFNESQRTFSHGCVRVENALYLAELLLQKEGFSPTELDSILTTEITHELYLQKPLPVMLMYWTCYERDGQLFFCKDIYGRDQQILQALDVSF